MLEDHSSDVARLLASIPPNLRGANGAAPYSGLASWVIPSPLYILGINPGGDPSEHSTTVAESTEFMLSHWNRSAYRDGEWGDPQKPLAPGTHRMQRSILQVLANLGMDPGFVPSSNLVYVRSRQANDIAASDMLTLAEDCWPFHADVIDRLGIRVVLAMGHQVSGFVRNKVGSHTLAGSFTEDNRRRLTSRLWVGGDVAVVQAVHPSRFPWDSAGCDITPLVAQALSMTRD